MTQTKLTLLFDGGCPLCQREVSFLRSRDSLACILFVDIDSPEYNPDLYNGISYREAMGRIHAITSSGETRLNFEFNGEDEKRKLYQDDIEGYRFNTWYDSKEKFYGGPRIDDPVEELQAFCDKNHICSDK